MTSDRIRRVVVAVGEDAGPAVDWAAAEAAARRCRLHVVHAERLRWVVDPAGFVPVADLWSYRAAAVQVLRDAVARARSVTSDVDVVAELGFGPVVPAVLDRSRGADLLVVGSRTPPFGRRWRPDVGARLADRAACPVALVRPLLGLPRTPSTPRVVVGVRTAAAVGAAVGAAFAAAAQRGIPLAVVHAWAPDLPADHEGVCGPAAEAEARAAEVLRAAVEPWRTRFAGVPVTTAVCAGDPATVLVRESDGAALLVVGAGGRHRIHRWLAGSVTRNVARRARCPVVVVGRDTVPLPPAVAPDRTVPEAEPLPRWSEPWE